MEEVLKGVSQLTLTSPLMETDIFYEDLSPKYIFLKVDEAVSGSHSDNVFPALKSSQTSRQFTENTSREKRMHHLARSAPLRKRTKPQVLVNPAVAKSTPSSTKTAFSKVIGMKVGYTSTFRHKRQNIATSVAAKATKRPDGPKPISASRVRLDKRGQ